MSTKCLSPRCTSPLPEFLVKFICLCPLILQTGKPRAIAQVTVLALELRTSLFLLHQSLSTPLHIRIAQGLSKTPKSQPRARPVKSYSLELGRHLWFSVSSLSNSNVWISLEATVLPPSTKDRNKWPGPRLSALSKYPSCLSDPYLISDIVNIRTNFLMYE
uniref:Uncharacterized protein n=1 Tax=Rousettus aegyptiacus TaxID=9407 RepID=A0A7J8GB31_ROUAE|nr:hypothetical protein HJG63_011634 [Rousettus aegyptiacus]